MGLFSRTPAPSLPERADLRRALDGLQRKDADRIRSKRHLAEACASIPGDAVILAVLEAVITEVHTTDRGLLCLTEDAVAYYGDHSGRMRIPRPAVLQVAVLGTSTVRVVFDETVPGVSVLPIRESPDQLDFGVTAKPESVRFLVDQVAVTGDDPDGA